MFVGFFQCHALASFAEKCGTMREHAAIWTQIGHTKSRSVHPLRLGTVGAAGLSIRGIVVNGGLAHASGMPCAVPGTALNVANIPRLA
jgi:hypothetical protein